MATIHRPHRIHIPDWRKIVTRRVLVVTTVACIGYGIEALLKVTLAGKGGELLIGAVIGHVLLEVEA